MFGWLGMINYGVIVVNDVEVLLMNEWMDVSFVEFVF